MIESFHTNMKGTVRFNGSSSRPFDIRSGVKQGCLLAPTLFGILFALLLSHAFGTALEGICLRTRSDGRLFNLGHLRTKTKVVYNACVGRTLMYGSETWTAYARQEKRLNSFHLRSIRRILGISWQDRVSNTEVLFRANLPSMFTLLRQRRLRWLGHVYRMEDGRVLKDILYGELASGRRSKGRPQLHYNDICKRDMKALDVNTDAVETHPEPTPQVRGKEAGECRSRKRGLQKGAQQLQQTRDHTQMGPLRQRLFPSHLGLYSHKRPLQQSNRQDNQDVHP